MSALTIERVTPRMGDAVIPPVLYVPVKASTKIYAGSIVVANAGYAAPGTTATSLVALGVANETADNSSGSNGTISVSVRQGVHKFNNSSAGDLIAQTEIGTDCYIVDDNTVAKTSATSTRSRAGKVVQIDSDGVWVQLGIGL